MSEENPFQSPAISAEVVSEQEFAVEYLRPFSFVFENPNWLNTLLMLGIMQFIPIVGPLAVIGYQYEIVIALLRRPNSTYPEFDFNRFGDYLTRGVWPFLAIMTWGMCIAIAIGVLVAVLGAAIAATQNGQGESEAEVLIVALMSTIWIVAMTAGLGIQILAIPLMLRSGLQKDYMAGFSLSFALQFIGNTWKEMIVIFLVLMLGAMVATAIGFALFCIGIYFTMGVVMIAQSHALMQLYRLHLSKGGQPVPIAE